MRLCFPGFSPPWPSLAGAIHRAMGKGSKTKLSEHLTKSIPLGARLSRMPSSLPHSIWRGTGHRRGQPFHLAIWPFVIQKVSHVAGFLEDVYGPAQSKKCAASPKIKGDSVQSRVTPSRDRGQVKPHGHKRLFKFDELSAQRLTSPETKVTTPAGEDMPVAPATCCIANSLNSGEKGVCGGSVRLHK